ncbi:unnamed protein product [Ilex paraguariensis]|uniref:Uncharacterized protein n=1 Tax=Ilex paraguariensis TaxID=185542 RepID=A0ABC8RGZ1_9AQUA
MSTNDGKFELKDDASNCSNSLSSENGKLMDANAVLPRNQRTSQMETLKVPCSPEMQKRHGFESTSIKVFMEGIYHFCNSKIEDSGPKQGRIGSKVEKNSPDPSCQLP